jgi:hypothetical protein
MDYNSENKYTVFFKDGTSLESSGNAANLNKSTVSNEFKWTAFHIEKEVLLAEKTLADIDRIEYSLKYEQ